MLRTNIHSTVMNKPKIQIELKQIAVEAVKSAGNELLKLFEKNINGTSFIDYKKDRDILIEADKKSNNIILDILQKSTSFNIRTEEDPGWIRTDSEYTWVIDPLDGTINFAHKIPHYAVSVALLSKNDIELGVTYYPPKDMLFYAIKHQGAFLNDTPIRVSRKKRIKNSIICISDGASDDDMIAGIIPYYGKFLKRARSVRVWGACQLDLCYVALGVFEGYLKSIPPSWDILASALIVEEAGGRITTFDGNNIDWKIDHTPNIVASNRILHKKILEIIRS